VKATLGLFGRPIPWRTTRKGFKSRLDWGLMWPQLGVLALSLAACAYALIKLEDDYRTGPLLAAIHSLFTQGGLPEGTSLFSPFPAGYTLDLVIVAGFWALYNASKALGFCAKVVRNANASHTFVRFPVVAPMIHDLARGVTRSLSETYIVARFEAIPPEWQVGEVLRFTLVLPNEELLIALQVEHLSTTEISGEILWSDAVEMHDSLAKHLYSMRWQTA
jgi:hypothetical protein